MVEFNGDSMSIISNVSSGVAVACVGLGRLYPAGNFCIALTANSLPLENSFQQSFLNVSLEKVWRCLKATENGQVLDFVTCRIDYNLFPEVKQYTNLYSR